jgi:secernin
MCDSIVIVKPGQVLFAKNSDRDPNEAQILEWHPRKEYSPRAAVRCTWIEIPQARWTNAVLLSRPFWMWGAEMGANEHGVTIGNEAVFTREPYAKAGLTGMDLLRLALERAETARAACDIISSLLTEHGQGGGCGLENKRFSYHNSFLIADPKEAYVFETAGRHWAKELVQGARTISNGLTIPGFAEQYSDFIKTKVSGCNLRRPRTQSLAQEAQSAGDLFGILRDHGANHDVPQYSWLNSGLNAPCVHGGGLVASSQTTASWVADLRPAYCLHWVTGTSSPCTGLFKPVRVEDPLELGTAPTDRADEKSLWWRHERFSRRVLANPAELRPMFEKHRDLAEERWLENPPDSRAAFLEGDALLAEWTDAMAARDVSDIRSWWVRRYWAKRNAWAGLSDLNCGLASRIQHSAHK